MPARLLLKTEGAMRQKKSIEPWQRSIESQPPVPLIMDGDGVFECGQVNTPNTSNTNDSPDSAVPGLSSPSHAS